MKQYDVLIVGGGSGGITTAARLKRADRNLNIAIVEPNTDHYYQPLWTLVGAGVATVKETRRDEAKLIPNGVEWIRDRVAAIDPDAHTVTLEDGGDVAYDQLVMALGIELHWDKVPGAREAIGNGKVVSNYMPEGAEATWQALEGFKGGTMMFTAPSGQIKCGGAPQKIMYLADDYLRKHGLRDQTEIIGGFAGTVMLGVPEINATLNNIVEERDLHMKFRHELVRIDGERDTAVFVNLDDENAGEIEMHYDFIHVTPPQRAPKVLRESKLAVAEGPHAGFADVDEHTLQHKAYPDVWALGDNAGVPTAKTGAAIRKQAPVLVEQLLAHRAGKQGTKSYEGYSSCPLVTGYGKLVLAEFEYGNTYKPTFPVDQTKQRWDMYMLKRHFLPQMYWHGMLRGIA
jgi:sulfide:quinone oxidoreductase